MARSPEGRPWLVQEFFLIPTPTDEAGDVAWDLIQGGNAFLKNLIPCTLGVGQAEVTSTPEEELFRRELLKLVRVTAVGLPPILHAGVGNGRALVVYQGFGEPLTETVARDGPVPADRARELANGLVDLLGPLHRLRPPVIMGELSPGRLYVDENGRVRVLAYGELRLLTPGRQGSCPALHSAFLSPERRRNAPESLATDVYCIGATLYLLLTGQAPALDTEDTPPPHQVNAQVPADLSKIVMTCLETNPDLRYSTCGELRDALAGRLGDRSTEPSPIILVDRAEIVEEKVAPGSQLSGSFTVTNAGGGHLVGGIETDFSWLTLDPTRLEGKRTSVQYRISTANLQSGITHRARIRLGVLRDDDEIRAARGQKPVEIQVSLAVMETRADRSVFNLGQLVRFLLPIGVVALLVAKAAGVSFSSILSALGIK